MWTVTLKAKGIQQKVKIKYLGAMVETLHELSTGSIVSNLFRIISISDAEKKAVAIFDRSRNRRVRLHGKSR